MLSIKKILDKNNLAIIKYKIWSPTKPNFKLSYKNFIFYIIMFSLNNLGNFLKLSQNMFIYAKNK